MTPIAKLEALLARIKANAAAPRIQPAQSEAGPTAMALAEPRREERDEPEMPTVEREIEPPLESRARLVAAQPTMEVDVEELEAEDVLELDERHVVQEVAAAPPARGVDDLAQTTESKPVQHDDDEAPPPSSRRPITEPAQTPQEAQIHVAHTPPPESGKQVAVEALSFDDDDTGVRDAPARLEVPKPEESIQLQSLRSPAVPTTSAIDEMEVELPSAPSSEATRPPPGPLSEVQSKRAESVPPPEPTHELTAEITRPTRPVAASHVAEMPKAVPVAAPKTFGELIDLALSL